jgi:hypothetical protein
VIDELVIGMLLYGVFPLWLIAGFADYCCHRVTRIDRTTGRAESTLHIVQYLQIVVGVALALFFEVTSLVLVILVALALLHLATGYLDIAYTTGRRYISPPEQHVHSHMEILPLVAAALAVLLHWDSFAAIFGGDAASWSLARREQALPAGPVAAIAVGVVLAGAAIAEEHVRCARRRKSIGAAAESIRRD